MQLRLESGVLSYLPIIGVVGDSQVAKIEPGIKKQAHVSISDLNILLQ